MTLSRYREKAMPRSIFRIVIRLALVLLTAAGALGVAAQNVVPSGMPATVLHLDGAITPATARYVTSALDAAAERRTPLVVLRMDTPGGLVTSMREIIDAILASSVPVATWIAPSGARGASAGTYIAYASHVAAMAPATSIGAATPVALGGGGGSNFPFGSGSPETPDAEDEGVQADPEEAPFNAGEAKALNDAVAYIRGLAELRGRNADWAEAAVRRAETLGALEAANLEVVDFVAEDVRDLLAQADGRQVLIAGQEVRLVTTDLPVVEVEPDWRIALLSVLTDPNVAILLMMIGFYGLVLEFLNPGVLIPGTIGGISLLLGLYALALLPLTYAGAGLILLGFCLIVAEAFAPSFGILGIGGTIALVLGATMLIDTDVPGLEISVPLIAGVAVAGIVATLVIARLAAKSMTAPVVSGREDILGAVGEIMDWHAADSGGAGHVWLQGERWRAVGPAGLAAGDLVSVMALEGLVLEVAPEGSGSHAPSKHDFLR